MKFLVVFILLYGYSLAVSAQKPKSGVYSYKILWDEFGGKDLGNTCAVKINGDSITVFHDGRPNLTGKKGDILLAGLIMKHKSGSWIIGSSSKDRNAKNIGGCDDGPVVINFRRKTIRLC